MNTRSLRFRLTGFYAGLLAIVMLLFGAYTYKRLDHFQRAVLQASLEHRAYQIAHDILPEVQKQGEAYIGSAIEARFAPAINDKFVRVTRRNGEILYRSSAPNDRNFVPEEVPQDHRADAGKSTAERSIRNGSAMLIASLPVTVGGQEYQVEVGTSLASNNRVLKSFLVTLAASLPLLTCLVIFGGYVLMNRALSPVRRIIHAAQEITLHNLNRRLPTADSGDEIADLSKVLNQMIERLDDSFKHISRFTADASHELRTPLTVMHCELEAMLRKPKLDPDLANDLGSLLEEVVRLVRIVEGLFALSKLDTGEARSQPVRFDLAKLAETTVEQMCLLAEEKHIELVCETSEPVEVEGDRSRLKQVIVNLLDNAIKYTPEGGATSLTVRAENGTAFLEVADNGPGVSDAALPHLFKRFYRADEAHSRDVEGAGLGLSIAQSICAAHGGSISVSNRVPTGCLVSVQLPRIK